LIKLPKLRVSKKEMADDEGILYLLYVMHEGCKLVKIGITKRPTIVDRVLEIVAGYYKVYRIFPEVYPKRHRRTTMVFKKEAMMHAYYRDMKVEFDKPFTGYTEMFKIDDEEHLLEVYQRVVDGEELKVNNSEEKV